MTLESRREISVTIFSYTNAIIARATVKSQPKAERERGVNTLSILEENSLGNLEYKKEQKPQEADL